MIHRTSGIVFRTIRYSETSVISKIYTHKFGMQSYITNGVRKEKSRTKAVLLQVMSMLDMEVYYHEHRNLHRIREMRSEYIFSSLLFNPLKAAAGLFMMEVLNKCIREEEPNEEMFSFISEKLQTLDRQEKIPANQLLTFLLELSSLVGFYPHGELCTATSYFDLQAGRFVADASIHPYMVSPPLSENFSLLIRQENFSKTSDFAKAEGTTQFDSPLRRKLLDTLLQYFQLHVPNFSYPKSLHVLQEIFQN
jgi:DNA repair protein RecO (recombination protein O)